MNTKVNIYHPSAENQLCGLQPALLPLPDRGKIPANSIASGPRKRSAVGSEKRICEFCRSLNLNIKKLIITLLFLFFAASPALAGELANQFTVSLWVNPTTSVTSKALAVKNTEIRLYTDASGYVNCAIYTSSWQTGAVGTTALPLNTWSHVSCTYDKANIKIFVNGILQNSVAQTNAVNDAATNWRVGSDESATYADLVGTIDDFKIYNYARTSAQIQEDMSERTKQPIGYWKFDEGYGTTTFNSGTGASLNGTITGATWSNSGKFGKALSFAGSTNSVSVASIANVGTVSLWVNPSTNSQSLLALTAGAYISASSGTITATGFTSPTIYVNGKVSSTLTASVWNHVVVTTDTGITASALTIGRANSASLTGLIDDVRIYNYALTSTQIKTLYNENSAVRFGP